MVLCHASKLETLIKELNNCPTLRLVIKMGGALTEQDKGTAEQIKMYYMEEVEVCEHGSMGDVSVEVCEHGSMEV